jgi:hypothetical protein
MKNANIASNFKELKAQNPLLPQFGAFPWILLSTTFPTYILVTQIIGRPSDGYIESQGIPCLHFGYTPTQHI